MEHNNNFNHNLISKELLDNTEILILILIIILIIKQELKITCKVKI
jgi:hypothetical protein